MQTRRKRLAPEAAAETERLETRPKKRGRPPRHAPTHERKLKTNARKATPQVKARRSKTGTQIAGKKDLKKASPHKVQEAKGHEPERKEAEDNIKVNRAPVLTMWVAVVAVREGYSFEEGLTFGKAVSGLLAQSKGRRLGLYEEATEEKKAERKKKRKELDRFSVFGMNIPGKSQDGLRLAVQSGKPIVPSSVAGYLHRSFGADYERAKDAMEDLANSFASDEIGRAAYSLYEKFRPTVPYGMKGWGAKGNLDVEALRAMRK